MKKIKKFYSLKSFRNDKASAKKYSGIMDKIISTCNNYRDALSKYFITN